MKPELVKKARDLMARASVIAERKSSNPNPSHGGKPESTPPTGYAETTVQEIHALFARCKTDGDLEDALIDAERELANVQRTPAANEDSIDRRDRLLRQGEGKDAAEVARWEGVPVKEIWQLRRDSERYPGDGRWMPKKPNDFYSTQGEREALVKRIVRLEPDLTWREIGLRVRVSHVQARRDFNAPDRVEDDKAA